MSDLDYERRPGDSRAEPRVAALMPGIVPVNKAEPNDDLDLAHLARLLWRGKWIIALCAFLAFAAGAVYVKRLAVPKFAAHADLLLQVRSQNVVELESVIAGISSDYSSLLTELEVMKSRPLIERLVEELNLTELPEFNPYLREPPTFTLHRAANIVRTVLGLPLPEKKTPTEDDIFSATVSAVSGAITVTNELNTYVFTISAASEDGEVAEAMANTLAEIYLDNQIQTKFSATEYAVNWLSQRVTELEAELKDKQDEIERLKTSSSLMAEAQLEALILRQRNLRERMSALETDRTAAEARLAALGAEAAPAQRAALTTEIAGLERQISALREPFDEIEAQIVAQNEERVRLGRLVREADATRVLYETFLARLKETSIQIGLQQADSRILSSAKGAFWVSPRQTRVMMLSLILGAALGIAIILARQLIRSGFRTGDELEQAIGYSVIGQIPRVPVRRRQQMLDYLTKKPTSAAAEAIRNLRTSVVMSNVDKPPQVILSTSSVPGEGKTTVAIALAQNLAGLDKRVLLIEADIRRRTLNQYFPQHTPGSLINVVHGTLELSEAVMHVSGMGFDVLLGDKSRINAADLFSSERFKEILKSARSEYDYIILDTPPVLVVPDARVIGRYADAILYSVKWDSTPRQQVSDGLRQLTSVNLRVTGLVLTQVNPSRMRAYGYGGRYGAYAAYGSKYYEA